MIKFSIQPATLRALEVFAAVKDPRRELIGIHVKVVDESTLRLTAADGTILASYWHKLGQGDPNSFTPGEEGIIPIDVTKGVKFPKYFAPVEFTITPRIGDSGVPGTWTATMEGITRSGDMVCGPYPRTDRVWPKRVDVQTAYYDPKIVARLGKAADLLGVKTRVVVIPNGREGAGVFKIREDFAGLIMPVQLADTDLTMPDWTEVAVQHSGERIKEAAPL